MSFNENTRVKIPALLHLHRLGYQYISLSNSKRDEETNIFTDIFTESIIRINDQELDEDGAQRLLEDVSLALDNEDLGEAFYRMLTATSGTKMIDFKDFDSKSFHVVTEMTCKNGDDEFRPDITLLINGMPLAFIEVLAFCEWLTELHAGSGEWYFRLPNNKDIKENIYSNLSGFWIMTENTSQISDTSNSVELWKNPTKPLRPIPRDFLKKTTQEARLYPFNRCDFTVRNSAFQEFLNVLVRESIVVTCKKCSVFRICRLENITITISNG